MIDRVAEKPDGKHFIQHIGLITGIILLPGLQWAIFGWLHLFLPLVVFFYLCRFGKNVGQKYLVTGTIIALLASTFIQALPQVIFAITLIPGGYILAHSARKGESVLQSGLRATITALLSWAVYWLLLSLTSEHSIYALLTTSLDSGVTEAIQLYRQNKSLTPEMLFLFEQTLREMQVFLPKILPALICSMALFTIWLAMVGGNALLQAGSGHSPWPEYQLWQLPDRLVWVFITAAILFILPGSPIPIVGVNLLIVTGLLYCIQGFAIVIYFFSKWNLPRFVRIVFYIAILFQTLGTLVLLGIGLSNTWADFRKLKTNPPGDSTTKDDKSDLSS